MTRGQGRKFCVNCGDGFRAAGKLCPDCMPAPAPAAAGAARTPICRACKAPVSWNTLLRQSRRLDNEQVECMYYCGTCGGIFEFAAWGSPPGSLV